MCVRKEELRDKAEEREHDLKHESCCMAPSSLTPPLLGPLIYMVCLCYRPLAQQINELL